MEENAIEQMALRHRWFSTVILPHQAALQKRLRRVLADPGKVEDHVAEALTRAYTTPDFAAVRGGRAYLFGIARNLVIDDARRSKIVSLSLVADLDVLHTGHDIEPELQARDELRRLAAVVAQLPEQCRRVFLLRRVEDRSTTEIAEVMGLSVSTVEKHLTKAVTRVMRAIRDQEELGLGRDAETGAEAATRGGGR